MGKVKKLSILLLFIPSILICQQKQNLNSLIHPQADKFISKQLYNKLYYNQYNSSLTPVVSALMTQHAIIKSNAKTFEGLLI